MSIAAAGAGASGALKEILKRRFLEQQEAARVQQEQIQNKQREQQIALQREGEARMLAGQQADEANRQQVMGRLTKRDEIEDARYAEGANARGLDLMKAEAALMPQPKKLMTPLKVRGAGGRATYRQFEEGDPELAQGVEAYDEPNQGPQPQYQWGKDKTGTVRLMTPQEIRSEGGQQPDTADMRNKEAGKRVAARAVKAVRAIGDRVITKIGPAQRAEALKRGAAAVFGNDPEFRTYQDARMALAGNLAVEQQGSRVSDADVKSLWLPMVPDAYSDTSESQAMKWGLIDEMRGAPQGNEGQAPTGGPKSGDKKTFPNGRTATFDGQGWVAD